MTAPFLPNAAYTNGRAALEGAYKRHAFFAGRGVALVAGCLGGRVGDGGGLVAGRSRGPRLRLTRAWQGSHAMHDSPLPPFLATWAFPFRLRKRPPEIVHTVRSLPGRPEVA